MNLATKEGVIVFIAMVGGGNEAPFTAKTSKQPRLYS
jgi:hypothetical protein